MYHSVFPSLSLPLFLHLLRHSSPPALSYKRLNCMLYDRGRDTEAKVQRPKRSLPVSPDEIGNDPLRLQGPELVDIGPSAPTAGRQMLKSHFFPRSKRTACVHAAHKHTVCERESGIRGMFGTEISVFMDFEGIYVHVCVSVPQIHTNLASGSYRKFFTCFLIEPHLPQAQTHIQYGHTDLKR